jgi:spermidine synthase
MVEIDAGVVETCKVHLPGLSSGAFDDPRVHLHIADAFPFLKAVGKPYDLIVMDVTDVYEDEEGELSAQLFTKSFHRDCLNALSDSGFLVTQADNHVFCPYSLEGVLGDLGSVFPRTGWYQALVPSFGGFSAFAWASKSAEPLAQCPHIAFEVDYLNATTYSLAFARLPFVMPSP